MPKKRVETQADNAEADALAFSKSDPGNDNTQADYVMFDIFMSPTPINNDDIEKKKIPDHVYLELDDVVLVLDYCTFLRGIGRYSVYKQLKKASPICRVCEMTWDFGDA